MRAILSPVSAIPEDLATGIPPKAKSVRKRSLIEAWERGDVLLIAVHETIHAEGLQHS